MAAAAEEEDRPAREGSGKPLPERHLDGRIGDFPGSTVRFIGLLQLG
jgi:hypothetical protein